jgi:hypothetical protein
MGLRLAPEDAETDTVRFALGLCTTAHEEDIASRLFTRAFADQLVAAIGPRVQQGIISGQVFAELSQDAVHVQGHSSFRDTSWDITAAWDGSIAISHDVGAVDYVPAASHVGVMIEAWDMALEMARSLGGHGDHYLAVRVSGKQFAYDDHGTRDPGRLPLVTRGPLIDGPDPSHRGRLVREIRRICGEPAYEDED